MKQTHRRRPHLDLTRQLVLVISSALFLLLGLVILTEQFVDIFAFLS